MKKIFNILSLLFILPFLMGALPQSANDREYEKFIETTDGKVAVRVKISSDSNVVPYTGATADVDLGTHKIKVGGATGSEYVVSAYSAMPDYRIPFAINPYTLSSYDGFVFKAGNMGIGTNDPSAHLHIIGEDLILQATAPSTTAELDMRTPIAGYLFGINADGEAVVTEGQCMTSPNKRGFAYKGGSDGYVRIGDIENSAYLDYDFHDKMLMSVGSNIWLGSQFKFISQSDELAIYDPSINDHGLGFLINPNGVYFRDFEQSYNPVTFSYNYILLGDTAQKVNLKFKGLTSGEATITTADVAGTPTLTLPTSTGTIALTSDIPSITGLATKALDNLASVAINTSLVSDTDSTDDLGSSAKYWANGYFDRLYLNSTAYIDGSTVGTIAMTGTLDVGAGTLYVLPGTHYVGIGTQSPGSPLQIVNDNYSTNMFRMDYYAAGTSGAVIRGYKYRGTVAAPRRARSGDTLSGYNVFGAEAANDSTDATIGNVAGQFLFATQESFTSTGHGTYFRVNTTPTGSASAGEAFRVTGENVMKIAGGAVFRGTTEGTNHLDIFDGTAPVGTLANGISIYSSSGECYIMDAAGNATLQSPHNDKGEWIFYSKNTKTGKVLRIDMEKMMKFLNDKFGTDFIKEYVE